MAYSHLSLPKKVPTNPQDDSDDIKQRSHVITTTHLVFEIHYDGVFFKMPTLKYQHGKMMPLKACKSKRMNFNQMLYLLSFKLEQDIRCLYFYSPRVCLQQGLTLVEGDYHMRKMYDTADAYGLIDLYVAHTPQNLAFFYYPNLTFDSYDDEILSKLKKHEEAMLVATSKSFADLIAWGGEEEGRSPPLRTLPSEPRMKGIHFQGKNLLKDFLHSDSIDDGFDFSVEDCMPGVVGLDVPALDVGWSRSPPYEWQNDVFRYNGSKLPSVSNDCFANEVVLDVGGSAVQEHGGTSVHPRTGRRVSKKKYSRKFYFGLQTSALRRRNMVSYFKALHKRRVSGGIGKTLSWFLRDGRLQSRVVVMKMKPQFKIDQPVV